MLEGVCKGRYISIKHPSLSWSQKLANPFRRPERHHCSGYLIYKHITKARARACLRFLERYPLDLVLSRRRVSSSSLTTQRDNHCGAPIRLSFRSSTPSLLRPLPE